MFVNDMAHCPNGSSFNGNGPGNDAHRQSFLSAAPVNVCQ